MESSRIEDGQEEQNGAILLTRGVYRNKLPAAIVAADYASIGHVGQLRAAGSPHGLKLDSNFVESLRNDGDKDVLNEPTQEENHRREIYERSPRGKRVHRTVPCNFDN